MARQLADVLHFFLDDAEPDSPDEGEARGPEEASLPDIPEVTVGPGARREQAPGPAPALAVAVAGGDVLRSAFVWGLALELGRPDAPATVVAPESARAEAVWPELRCPTARLLTGPAPDLEALGELAGRVPCSGGPALVAIPPAWLGTAAPPEWLRWLLLFSRPEPEELAGTRELARWADAHGARVGVALHGVHSAEEGRAAFAGLVQGWQPSSALRSYGVVTGELDVYRSIARRQAVTLDQPDSPAARGLRDLAARILQDRQDRQDRQDPQDGQAEADEPASRLCETLRSQTPQLEPLLEDVLGLETRIPVVARDPEGRAWVVLTARPGQDREAFADALAQSAWLAPRLADWCKLAPELGLRPELGAGAILLAERFDPRTREAAKALGRERVRLLRAPAPRPE